MIKKISLCLIVGNVAEYIERCLTSFAPIADEICIVRAIGNQTPDKTMDIARSVCLMWDIPFREGEYKNAPDKADWPHVDSFAAARQMSFDLATGEYCFWCDSDDVLESGAEVVRELAERGGYPAFVFPYNIFGKGMSVPRERMMLKSSGVWQFAVHECFKFHVQPVQGIEDQRVVVKHIPHLTKTGSNSRNLRILQSIPESEMTTGLLYHLHLELALSGDIPASVEVAKKVLARPDLGKPERYELFLNLAQTAKDPTQKNAILHQAYAADPCRREAIGLLCNNAMNYGRNEEALSFARQMKVTSVPKTIDWNDRKAIYGWVGDDLYAQALRCNGANEEAEIVRQHAFRQAGGPRISLIHATRGRPEQASMARKMWLDLANQPDRVEHLFVFDDDDKESAMLKRFHHLCLPAGGGCVAAWNHGALSAGSQVIIALSDDWTPFPGWDDAVLQRLGDVNEPKVLAVSDGLRTDQLLCMAICTRAYFQIDNFLFHPWFKSMYSDNWFTELAYARGCVVEAKDIVFTHEHPIKTGKPLDATYAQQNSPERYQQGEETLNLLRKKEDWSTVPGFFNYWDWYQTIARWLKDGDVVAEVGCWMGRSLIYLAQECKRLGKNKVKFYAVDHFKGESNQKEHEATVRECGGSLRSAFEANIKRCGVADMITIIDGDSAESASQFKDGELTFCYIDAAHDYESVIKDIKAWSPKVKQGGILSGHDARWHEVEKAVKELIPEASFNGDVWARI